MISEDSVCRRVMISSTSFSPTRLAGREGFLISGEYQQHNIEFQFCQLFDMILMSYQKITTNSLRFAS